MWLGLLFLSGVFALCLFRDHGYSVLLLLAAWLLIRVVFSPLPNARTDLDLGNPKSNKMNMLGLPHSKHEIYTRERRHTVRVVSA